VPNELKTAEQLIETAPDSALQMLRKLPPHKYKYAKNRALYGLLMIQALDKKILPLKPDSLLDFSIAYYQEHPNHNRLATCYLYKGRTYNYYNQYERAMNYYLKALDECKDTKDNMLLGRINLDLGDIYSIQNDYVQARLKYELAYKYFIKAKNKILAFYTLLTKGRTYYLAKEYKKAEIYYRKIVPQYGDSVQHAALFQEIGLNFYAAKNLDSALFILRRIKNYPYIGNNKAIRYNILSKIFFDLENVDSAFYYAQKTFSYNPTIRTQRESYRILANSEFKRGNFNQMSVYMNKYVQLSDSIRKIDAQIKGSYMETTHEANKEAKVNKIQKWISWGFVLILVICFLYMIRYFLRREEKEKLHIQEIHTGEKVDIRKKVIVDKQIILQQKIEEQKIKIMTEKKGINLHEREDLIREIYNEILHINDLKFFFGKMDIDFNNLVTKLKSRYSGINDKEITWCCLYLLRIPASDMYLMLDYTVNGLKKMRQRLALKMNVQGVSELYTLLDEMLYE